jgi:hypothetical protein
MGEYLTLLTKYVQCVQICYTHWKIWLIWGVIVGLLFEESIKSLPRLKLFLPKHFFVPWCNNVNADLHFNTTSKICVIFRYIIHGVIEFILKFISKLARIALRMKNVIRDIIKWSVNVQCICMEFLWESQIDCNQFKSG